MSVLSDILASYGGPRRVIRRRLAMGGAREDRALALLMAGCALVFVAQWPRLAREAHMTGEALNPLLGGALMAWLFIMPLVLYALAFLSHLLLRVLARGATGQGGSAPNGAYASRIALFWALLAASPLMLLWGLVAGFIGAGPARDVTGAAWLGVFLWFWLSGLAEARRAS